jgi:hypothetical protein
VQAHNLFRVAEMLLDRAEKLNHWLYRVREDYFHVKLKLDVDDFAGRWDKGLSRTYRRLIFQPKEATLAELSDLARRMLDYARTKPKKPKYRQIAHDLEISQSYVRNGIKELEQHGLWPLPDHRSV